MAAFENVRYSVNKFLKEKYITTTVRYYGLPGFKAETINEWIEPLVMGPYGQAARRTNQEHNRYILNINIYSRVDIDNSSEPNRRNVYRVYEIADVLTALLEKKSIPFWTTAGAYLGIINVGEASTAELGVDEGLMGVNLSFELWSIRATS